MSTYADAAAKGAAQVSVGSKVKTASGFERVIPASEVAQHTKDDDCWMIIHGKVYDVTGFLVDHPGGPEILTNEAGTDATAKFEEVFHSDDARKQLKDFCVGVVEGYTGALDAATNRGKKANGSGAGQAQAGAGTNPAVFLLGAAAIGAALYFFVL